MQNRYSGLIPYLAEKVMGEVQGANEFIVIEQIASDLVMDLPPETLLDFALTHPFCKEEIDYTIDHTSPETAVQILVTWLTAHSVCSALQNRGRFHNEVRIAA